MPKVLETSQIDQVSEELLAEEQILDAEPFALDRHIPGDLSDGGRVGGVNIFPTENGQRVARGRATVIRAWMWNGTETTLPLAYEPTGKTHDNAMRYRRKRHCLCCRESGFVGLCRQCRKNECRKCNSGEDRKQHIACFYLRYKDVPFPQEFYGKIPCFLPMCARTGDNGFKSQDEMRMHARNRHRQEYQSHLETAQAQMNTGWQGEIAVLRAEIAALRQNGHEQPSMGAVAQETTLPTGIDEAPLYVSNKPKPAKRGRRKKQG